MKILIALLCVAVSWSNILGNVCAHEVAKEMHDAAMVLVDSLDTEQQESISFEFDDQLRKDWQFIPMERKGLAFSEMRHNQQLLAMSLVQTALSHRGFSKTVQVMALEQILHEMENNAPKRNPEKYCLFFFGKPSTETTWAWRIEGHHLSMSFTIVDGQTIVSTPAFFGSNPGEVREGAQSGLRVLGEEEDLGRRLIKSLSVEQKETAIISDNAPKDVINGPGRDATPLEPAGIAAAGMNAAQQKTLRELIDLYVKKLRAELAADDLKKIEDAGFEKIHFAWAGQIQPGKPHYYRIQGPTFIMEYDNTQNNANHVHTVWRDFRNDFGADLLKQHYKSQSHEKQEAAGESE